jgi:4-hydroxy-tetrahydrodipicolinate reductase
MRTDIVIAGIGGRMGQALARAAGPEFSIVGVTEHAASPLIGAALPVETGSGVITLKVTNDPAVAGKQARAWIDFTTPEACLNALERLKTSNIHAAIIGTTGFTEEEEDRLAAMGERFAIVRSGNFSIGVNLLLRLVEEAARTLGQDWDIEICEAHHRHKVDAPSGTALMIGEAAARGRGSRLSDLMTTTYATQKATRRPGDIGVSSRRAGGVIGDHEAMFASEAEILTLAHRAVDRSIFARGALRAAQWAIEARPGLYSMQDVLSGS